jgi:hypothetical protein
LAWQVKLIGQNEQNFNLFFALVPYNNSKKIVRTSFRGFGAFVGSKMFKMDRFTLLSLTFSSFPAPIKRNSHPFAKKLETSTLCQTWPKLNPPQSLAVSIYAFHASFE